jgi:hypothetical protein
MVPSRSTQYIGKIGLAPGGKLIVAGSVHDLRGEPKSDLFLTKFDSASGNLDTIFGQGSGVVRFNFEENNPIAQNQYLNSGWCHLI